MIELLYSVCPLDGLFLEVIKFWNNRGILHHGILAVVAVASLCYVGI